MTRRSESKVFLVLAAAITLLGASSTGLAAALQADEPLDIDVSPAEAFPLQEIAIRGLPGELAGIELRAIPLDASGNESGEAIPLYAMRLEAGVPVFPVPPHPAGLDAGGDFRLDPDGREVDEPLTLRIKPLPASRGETRRVLDDLDRIADALTRAGGGEGARLRDGPIEDVPLHLFGVALSLRALQLTETMMTGEDLAWADRWLATRSSWSGLSELADRLAALPEPPIEGESSEARSDDRGPESPFQFASIGRRVADEHADGRHSSLPPWEQVEICTECPGTLNHWMSVQAEFAEGYGNLAERMARDRDLFDFVESLKGRETKQMTSQFSAARNRARKAAGNPLKQLETPGARQGLMLLEAVLGVATQTFEINDRFLAALLPSELLPASGSVRPDAFNEDDKRAELEDPEAATWRLRVTARSGQLVFTAQDLLGHFSRLKSVIGKAESGVFGDAGQDEKVGLCIPGGAASKDAEPGTGEAACELAGQLIDQSSRAIKRYERARKGLGGLGAPGGEDGEVALPEPNFEVVRYGPYVWPGINVSDARWSTVRALGPCVRVVFQSPMGPWRSIAYSPADPGGTWGFAADLDDAPRIGIKPAAAGNCEVRISTRPDRFGDALPVHLDWPVSVPEIRVSIDPNRLTLESGENRKFQATVRNADSVDVGWSAPSGTGKEVACESGESGRPCYDWTAPELDDGECRRPVRITAESLARRGLRALDDSPREGYAYVTVEDPSADLRIVRGGSAVTDITLDPEEDVRLAVTGSAAEGEIRWTATGGSIGGSGRRVRYVADEEPGTYRITASSEKSENCAPSITVTVTDDREDYHEFVVGGEVSAISTGRMAIVGMPMGNGLCYVQLWFVDEGGVFRNAPGLFVNGMIDGGFERGEYSIGYDPTIGNDQSDMAAAPNILFADLGLEDGSFQSSGGVLSINDAGKGYIKGALRMFVEESAPWDDYRHQREASVTGDFAAILTEEASMLGQGYTCRPPPTR